jgi:RNA polymerase sigma factor (TIGR02999 family)
MPQSGEITSLLAAANAGDGSALERVFPLVYEALKRVAHRQLAGERPDHTLNTGALVHEAYLKLTGLDRVQWRDRAHFFAVAAGAMRRILIDYAERRRAIKRGGGRDQVPLDRVTLAVDQQSEELIELDDALRRLEALDPRQVKVVECRFFAGMSVEETAAALGVSPPTVKRDWTMARAWLSRELGP